MAYRRPQFCRFSSLLVRNTVIKTQSYVTCNVVTTCDNLSSRHHSPRAMQSGSLRKQRLVLSLPYGFRLQSRLSSEELMSDKFAAPAPSATGVDEPLFVDKFVVDPPWPTTAQDLLTETADVAMETTDVAMETANVAMGTSSVVMEATRVVTGTITETASYIFSKIVSLCKVGLLDPPVSCTEFVLEQMNLTLGMPWLPTIIVTTLFLRLLQFPVFLMGAKNAVRLKGIRLQVEALKKEYAAVKKEQGTEAAMKIHKKLVKLFHINDVVVWKGFGMPWLNLPVVLVFFTALHNLTEIPLESMKTGGLWFFSDLTVPDPYYVLPVTGLLLLQYILEKGTDGRKLGTEYKVIFRISSLVSLPVLIQAPAAVQFYLFTSCSISLVQRIYMAKPAVKKYFNIPTPKAPESQEDAGKKDMENSANKKPKDSRRKGKLKDYKAKLRRSFKGPRM